MKSIAYGSGLSVPDFNVSPTDPLYWLLRACYEDVTTYKALFDADIAITQTEESDLLAAEAYFQGLSSNLQDWFQAASAASAAGEGIPALEEDYIPELIQFIILALSGQWGAIFVLFVKVGLEFVVNWMRERLAPGNQRNDIAECLDSALLLRDEEGAVVGSILSQIGSININVPLDEVVCTVWAEAYNV